MLRRTFGPCPPGGRDNVIDHARHFQMAIGLIAEPRRRYRLFLRRMSPFFHARRRRLAQKPCLAEHGFYRFLDFYTQAVDDMPHSLDPVGTAGNLLKTVADRLFAWDVRCCTEDGGEEARRAFGHVGAAVSFAPAKTETGATGFGINIDEAPIDLAPRRAVAQCADGLIERRVGQHRSVDQHCVLGHACGILLRQYALQECIAALPIGAGRGE